jgi:hypothetical protein
MRLIDPYRGRARPKVKIKEPSPQPGKWHYGKSVSGKGDVTNSYLRGLAGGEAHPNYFRTDRTRK